ncbi:hypothetical protein HJA76_32220 [Rhizobium bangladeshense]|uniref:hypothetical protein n=1 Tax=Rhizobium bangladeshense TaxID=1138189 RepID=UPI001C82B00C|nr:hypothetical protein [Rhizobium bangladeshense]MBX4924272.1 hypothetical protein [Rhizobium bangladeshense]
MKLSHELRQPQIYLVLSTEEKISVLEPIEAPVGHIGKEKKFLDGNPGLDSS